MIHEDERRTLESFPEAKVITAKKRCILGDHYHKIKTEKFILLSGTAIIMFAGEDYVDYKWMEMGKVYDVNPGIKHAFDIFEGSILLGLCSHPYDPEDDIS